MKELNNPKDFLESNMINGSLAMNFAIVEEKRHLKEKLSVIKLIEVKDLTTNSYIISEFYKPISRLF